MNLITKLILPCACAVLLASCGGETNEGAAPKTAAAVSSSQSSAQQVRVAADYYPVVQSIYLAYFGRPADPAGLVYFAGRYKDAGAAIDVRGVVNSYSSNATVKALIDSFATSQESLDLYPGANDVFVTAIYRNLLNRDADQAGKDYWMGLINSGAVTRANAAVSIMAGAQGTDLDLINKRALVVVNFTNAVNTPNEEKAYSGLAANAVVRSMMASVTLATDVAAFQATIDSVLANLVAQLPTTTYAQVATIIQNRCVGCHSSSPSIAGFNPAPLGIKFDTEAQIRGDAARIYNVAVVSQAMPYGNFTGMTQAERDTVGAWYNAGRP